MCAKIGTRTVAAVVGIVGGALVGGREQCRVHQQLALRHLHHRYSSICRSRKELWRGCEKETVVLIDACDSYIQSGNMDKSICFKVATWTDQYAGLEAAAASVGPHRIDTPCWEILYSTTHLLLPHLLHRVVVGLGRAREPAHRLAQTQC